MRIFTWRSEEIIKLERRIDDQRSEGVSAQQIAAAERRLDLLRDAAHRNRKPSLDDLRAPVFFGKGPVG